MSNYLPFYEQNGSNVFNDYNNIDLPTQSDKVKSPSKVLNIIIFIILLIIVIYYFYYMIYKKYKNFTETSSSNIKSKQTKIISKNTIEDEEESIDPNFFNTVYLDSESFEFDEECSESTCLQLSCGDNEILLRKKDECCPECVNIGGDQEDNNLDYLKRLEQLNKFVNKNISDLKFKANYNEIGRNTTKVTFSLIDRLSEFNYTNFNLEEFITIFNKEDEYIYVGIIFFIIGLFFVIFSK